MTHERPVIFEVEPAQVASTWPVMQQLRPHLDLEKIGSTNASRSRRRRFTLPRGSTFQRERKRRSVARRPNLETGADERFAIQFDHVPPSAHGIVVLVEAMTKTAFHR